MRVQIPLTKNHTLYFGIGVSKARLKLELDKHIAEIMNELRHNR
jgi:hypothetical protein